MLLSHTNTITMGDIRAPSMDWSHPDRASTYKLFGQRQKHALANNHHVTTPDLAIDPSPVTDPPTVDGKEDRAAAAGAMVRIPVMTVEV